MSKIYNATIAITNMWTCADSYKTVSIIELSYDFSDEHFAINFELVGISFRFTYNKNYGE